MFVHLAFLTYSFFRLATFEIQLLIVDQLKELIASMKSSRKPNISPIYPDERFRAQRGLHFESPVLLKCSFHVCLHVVTQGRVYQTVKSNVSPSCSQPIRHNYNVWSTGNNYYLISNLFTLLLHNTNNDKNNNEENK